VNEADATETSGSDDPEPDAPGTPADTAGGDEPERPPGSEIPAAHADADYDGDSDAPMADEDDDD